MKLKEKGQKLKNLEKKREEMEKIKNANFGTEVDEETFLGIIVSVFLGTKFFHSTIR